MHQHTRTAPLLIAIAGAVRSLLRLDNLWILVTLIGRARRRELADKLAGTVIAGPKLQVVPIHRQ